MSEDGGLKTQQVAADGGGPCCAVVRGPEISTSSRLDDECRRAMFSFLKDWGPLGIDDDVLHGFSHISLSPDLVHALQSIGAVETNAIHQLGNALVAQIGEDPLLSEFLPRWAAEEAEHGQVLRRVVLESQGIVTSRGRLIEAEHYAIMRQRRSFLQRHSRLLVAMAVRTVPDLTALYATFGAFQEHSVMQGYRLLGRRAQIPLLSEVLGRIVAQEQRHFRVYLSQARQRLTGNRNTQRITRRGLEWFWKPVGFDALGTEGWDRVCSFLCPTVEEEAFLARTDDVMGRLPGLEGLHLMRRAIDQSKTRTTSRLMSA